MKEKLHQCWRSLRHFKLILWRIYALRIFYCLFRYFRPVQVREGFTLTTPNELISYWYFFAQHEFDSPIWMVPFQGNSSPVCVDIGANYGVFSRYLLHLNPSAKIVAFEPMAEAHKVLSSIQNLGLIPIALGAENSQGTFEMSTGNFKQLVVHPENQDGHNYIGHLDAYHLKPFLAKIDVEGMELDVVRGGLNTLQQTPFIIIESSPDRLEELDALLPKHHCKRLTIVDWLYYLDQ